MAKPYIRYRSGYKYWLAEEYQVKVSIIPENNVPTDKTTKSFIELNTDGVLVIKKGYAWDGPSGPTIDTPSFMRGSLVHDALYQLMRNKLIDKEKWRKKADGDLKRMCVEDGMSRIRAWWVHQAVRCCGDSAASEEMRKEVKKAP